MLLKLLISFWRWRVSTNEILLGELCPEYKPASWGPPAQLNQKPGKTVYNQKYYNFTQHSSLVRLTSSITFDLLFFYTGHRVTNFQIFKFDKLKQSASKFKMKNRTKGAPSFRIQLPLLSIPKVFEWPLKWKLWCRSDSLCIQTRLANHFYTNNDLNRPLSTQQNVAHVNTILVKTQVQIKLTFQSQNTPDFKVVIEW